jgi:predicted TIM-barrel fold metal-dependent hydrolase
MDRKDPPKPIDLAKSKAEGDMSRRRVITGGVGIAVAGGVAPAVSAASAARLSLQFTSAARIDVHQHLVPPRWRAEMERRKTPLTIPPWSPEAALAFMDTHRIGTGILSLSAPGVVGWEPGERRDEARATNEYTASLVKTWPERFGNFATLPLPDVEASLAEIAYALDTLKADGVILFSNYGDRYLGHADFAPLWAELDRRYAVVFVHPTRLNQPETPGVRGPIVDFPFNTAKSAIDIVLSGVFDRHAHVKVILSHGGGFLPYAAYRFAALASATVAGAHDVKSLMAQMRRFYFDTAITHADYALPSLKAFADPTRILTGSDFPYVPAAAADDLFMAFDTSPLLTAAERFAINRGNAEALFPARNRLHSTLNE